VVVSPSGRGGSGSGVGHASGRDTTISDAATSTGLSTGGGAGLGDEDCIFAGASGSNPNFVVMDERRASRWSMRRLWSSNLAMIQLIVVVVAGSTVLGHGGYLPN
jgi:hypothetical protein